MIKTLGAAQTREGTRPSDPGRIRARAKRLPLAGSAPRPRFGRRSYSIMARVKIQLVPIWGQLKKRICLNSNRWQFATGCFYSKLSLPITALR